MDTSKAVSIVGGTTQLCSEEKEQSSTGAATHPSDHDKDSQADLGLDLAEAGRMAANPTFERVQLPARGAETPRSEVAEEGRGETRKVVMRTRTSNSRR